MSDYNFLMESRLSPEQNAVISLLSHLAAEQGQSLYLVGGAVRDLTYGQQIVRDLDFSVECPLQRILRAIPRADSIKPGRATRGPGAEAPLALEYQDFNEYLNVADLLFTNGVRAELAMCREETYGRPGQRPEVRPAMVFEDLKRRDFAINAMAVSLHPNSRGLLLDPTNGAGDMERHEIRALHSHGFLDDPVRIFRLLRLGLRLDFKPDERTQRWLEAAMAERAWERLDADQQARELCAILHEDQPARILKMLTDKKLLGGLDRKLATVRIAYDRFARIRNVLQSVSGADPFLLNFHYLVEKLGRDHAARLAKKIIKERKAIRMALTLEQDAKKLERVLGSSKAHLPSQVYTLLSPQPQPVLLYLLVNTKSAKVQNRIKSYIFKFPQIHARLPRRELQSLGIKPGPQFDHIIAEIFAMQLDGKIKSHPQLMKEMRALAGIKEPPPLPPAPIHHPPRKGKDKHSQTQMAAHGERGPAPAIEPPVAASKPVEAPGRMRPRRGTPRPLSSPRAANKARKK